MVGQIHRSVDGRFVLSDSSILTANCSKMNATTLTTLPDDDRCMNATGVSTTERRNSIGSQNSSSDDGGFLSRRHTVNTRSSWRRPLVASSSHLSLQSTTNSNRGGGSGGFMQGLGGLLRVGASNGSVNGCNIGGARYQNVDRNPYGYNIIYRNLQPQPGSRPLHQNLHINTLNIGGSSSSAGANLSHLHRPITPNLYTTSRGSNICSGSPASTVVGGCLTSPWITNNHHYHFNDPNSAYTASNERSFPTSINRYRYYSHELPSLRTIQEETRRMSQQQHGFVPLHVPSPPSWRGYYHTQTPYHSYRPRTRWYPRHHSRLLARSQSELMSPLPHLNLSTRAGGIGGISSASGIEASPESRSSSSGFGSKNTSNQQHGSHHSGSTSEWRLLPPYRPPPPPSSSISYFHPSFSSTLPASNRQQAQAQQLSYPHHYYHQDFLQQRRPSQHLLDPQSIRQSINSPYSLSHQLYPNTNNITNSNYYSSSLNRPSTPPYTMSNWLDMISRLNAATDTVNLNKAVDVGSVDGHYEFDPSTPTPSASTPTGGPRDDINPFIDNGLHHPNTNYHHLHNYHHHHHHHTVNGSGESVGPSGNGIFHTATSGMPMTMPHLGNVGGHLRKSRVSRYDNIDVRLQAMKEEFYAYRKRQAMKRAGVVELESMC